MTLDYGNSGIFLIMGNAEFVSSTIHYNALYYPVIPYNTLYYPIVPYSTLSYPLDPAMGNAGFIPSIKVYTL